MKKLLLIALSALFSMGMEAQNENPQGLYRLQRFAYEGKPEKTADFEQYKYCGKNNNAFTLNVYRNDGISQISMQNNDSQPIVYTGKRDATDTDHTPQVFDSNKEHFTFRWYNTGMNSDIFPINSYIEEIYDANIGIENDVKQVVGMLESKFDGMQGKLAGCWLMVGDVTMKDGVPNISTDRALYRTTSVYRLFNDDMMFEMMYVVGSKIGQSTGFLSSYTFDGKILTYRHVSKVEVQWVSDGVMIVKETGNSENPQMTMWIRSTLPNYMSSIFSPDVK